MQAIQFNQYGPANVLQCVEIDQPEVTEDTLLIKVHAAGVNPIDAKIRDGSSFVCQSLTLPSGLGFDLCGEVIACGKNVDNFHVGQMVFGSVGRHDHPCAYAEFCLAQPDQVVAVPEALSNEAAAALVIAGLTAWQAVHQHGHVKAGDTVLVHAAAGGVGHLAVQYANLGGATVIATASEKHHEFLKSLGVDKIIDYKKEKFENNVKDVDVVIDLVGGDTGIRSLQVLKPHGLIVTVPTITRDEILAAAKDLPVEATGMLAENNLDDLSYIAELCANQKVTIQIARSFPLDQAIEAHKMLEAKQTQGKIVLTP
ncbi:MAG: NADP-dependent oxidoreductase [Coxiellaceae bacterium]|nr:NADP-dependent oxidoreductase [Coxiellaceae bacterium]